MVYMKGMVDPTDKEISALLHQVETLGFNAQKLNDITDAVKNIIDELEKLTEVQRRNFMGKLLFDYAGYYHENFKAREKANYCKKWHSDRR